ncbi:hypothetical protein LTH96_08335 [Nesterenkonia sp. LB17]|uniref:hypothetical protein n=1 Tax=unclassified Nesterenkonia TaxID=2629769 RepID=UPI001F4D1BD5|nr:MULTISPECIES: hypothetical protein [unclassified Nesterenkonia]MCH8560407.1 hypothetical protein [Nesterenkonia sp. DZ6]MCH8565723.1 hypothetical protein [Nesterenkonia sp. LB17]MCH8570515.1 hypothetical protein [Nesterenkonia sp. AY15]
MTTPAPEKPVRRRRPPRKQDTAARPVLRLGAAGWIVSWLVPTAVMGGLLLALGLIPGLNEDGFLAPLIPLIAAAAVVVGIPGTLLVSWLYRHQVRPTVHILGYVLVGLLYGPVVLVVGAGGLIPMLIPLIGFPAGILLGIGRWMAQPLARVENPAEEPDPAATPEPKDAEHA